MCPAKLHHLCKLQGVQRQCYTTMVHCSTASKYIACDGRQLITYMYIQEF